jgi:hypothetical protein
MKTPACVVIFGHHRDCAVTKHNLALLRKNLFPVIPVHFQGQGHLEGSAELGSVGNPWAEGDQFLIRWFRNRPFDAERYLYLEWDCWCSLPIPEWFQEVWDADVSTPRLLTPREHPDWYWFSQVPALPPEFRPHACGMAILNGIMLSHRALEAVASMPLPQGIFSELRIGTMAQAAGFKPVAWPAEKDRTNRYFQNGSITFNPAVPGLYHPVKSLPG